MANGPTAITLANQWGTSLDFNTGVDPLSLGCEYWCPSLEGWDSPTVRQKITPRAGTRNAVVAESFYDARALTLSGKIWAPTPDKLWAARNRLSLAAECVEADGTLTVYEPSVAGGTKNMKVRRAGPLKIGANDGTDGADFQIQLIAPDSRKYATSGTTLSLTAGVTNITTTGTTDTPPVFVVSGVTATGPLVFEFVTGPSVTVNTNLTPSQTLIVDMNLHNVASPGGTYQWSWVDSSSVWWTLPPGNSQIYTNVACQLQYWNAWS